MNELQTVPNSLREQLVKAQNLLAQSDQANNHGNTDLAVIRAREGMELLKILAREDYEIAALLFAVGMGFTGIEYKTSTIEHGYEMVDRTFLGISLGRVPVPVTTSKVVTRYVGLCRDRDPFANDFFRGFGR